VVCIANISSGYSTRNLPEYATSVKTSVKIIDYLLPYDFERYSAIVIGNPLNSVNNMSRTFIYIDEMPNPWLNTATLHRLQKG